MIRFWHGVRMALLLLGVIAGVKLLLFRAESEAPDDPRQIVEKELQRLCPSDPLLASRMAAERLYVALGIAQAEGYDGLRAVDLFGDDAVWLFQHRRNSFHDLKEVACLDGCLHAESVGPWRHAVLDWAMNGTLSHFISRLRGLSSEDADLFRQMPESLPLLCVDAPVAKEMLRKFGRRAWQLFMLIDFTEGDSKSVERVATALSRHGEQMLEVNESFGLAVALFFLPPIDDANGAVPDLFAEALSQPGG